MIIQSQASEALRAAMYVAFARELGHLKDGPIEPEVFSASVAKAIDAYSVSPNEISAKFGVTAATVSRWKNGEAAPGTYLRTAVIEWLADTVEPKAPMPVPEDHFRRLQRLALKVAAGN